MLTVDSMLTLTAAGLYAHSYLKSLIFEALPKSHWLESRSKGLVCVLLLNSFIPENADEQTSGTALRLSSGNRRPTHSHFGFVCSVLALEAETHQSPPVYSASAKLLNEWKILRKSLRLGETNLLLDTFGQLPVDGFRNVVVAAIDQVGPDDHLLREAEDTETSTLQRAIKHIP